MSYASTLTCIGSGLCYNHPPATSIPMTGTIITGSPNVIEGDKASSYITSIVLGHCGHIGIIVDAAPNVIVNNLKKGRIGSFFTGVFIGYIITGLSTIEVGG